MLDVSRKKTEIRLPECNVLLVMMGIDLTIKMNVLKTELIFLAAPDNSDILTPMMNLLAPLVRSLIAENAKEVWKETVLLPKLVTNVNLDTT